MSDQLVALRLFIRVARTRSFSRAAKEARLSQPTASRMMTQLEEQLGVTLLARSTRAVTLTEAGAEYLERVEGILAALDEANQSVRGSGELRGTLRVGAAAVFAANAIVPTLGQFLAEHPALRVELLIDDKRQNLLDEGVDMVVRLGKLADSSASARKVGSWPLLVAAAPSYLKAHGTPKRPEDLARHRVIVAGPTHGPWVFRANRKDVTVKVDGQLAIRAGDVALRAATAGLGVVTASEVALGGLIERGELVRLLPEWSLGEIEAHALFPGRDAKPAARAFTDHLLRSLAQT